MVSKGTIFFFDKQIFRVRVYIKEIQARARAGLCTWRYWVVMCVVEFLVLLIFFCGCNLWVCRVLRAWDWFFSKKLQKHLEVTAKVCNFALAFEKEAGQRPGTDSGLTTFPTIFWRKSLAEKKKSVTLRGCSGAPTRKAEKDIDKHCNRQGSSTRQERLRPRAAARVSSHFLKPK